jgi:hypothetical protein
MSFAKVKALVEAEEFDEALAVVGKSLNENPEDPIMHYMAGRIMIEKGWPGMAGPLALKSASISPKSWEAWNLLGKAQSDVWHLDDARESFRMALQLAPKQTAPLSNMALVDHLKGNPSKAVDLCQKVLSVEDCDNTKHNMGMALLALRQWEPGWKFYEYGLGNHSSRKERIYQDPDEGRWDGTKGKTVVAYGEQGIGDEISFASTLPCLIRDCKTVVECDSRLEGLFKRSFPEADVYGTRFRFGNAWPAKYKLDGRVAFSSLQKFYRSKDSDFDGKPYLVADPERRKQWKALLDDLPGLKVGVAWTGGTPLNGKQQRSLSLDDLLPILSQKASFVSLEYRDPTADLADLRKRTGIKIHEWGRATRTQDYDDTAALVAELDLVISVTTAVIHLAGGLGKETWVMTHKTPMWRYGLEGDMPWYSSVKLYRQKTDWTSVVHKIAEDLSARIQ